MSFEVYYVILSHDSCFCKSKKRNCQIVAQLSSYNSGMTDYVHLWEMFSSIYNHSELFCEFYNIKVENRHKGAIKTPASYRKPQIKQAYSFVHIEAEICWVQSKTIAQFNLGFQYEVQEVMHVN